LVWRFRGGVGVAGTRSLRSGGVVAVWAWRGAAGRGRAGCLLLVLAMVVLVPRSNYPPKKYIYGEGYRPA